MADNDDGPLAKPGADPYEIEWPDDAKEIRAAEREQQAQRALVRPAPRYLTAIVIGVGMVLVFLLPIALAVGDIGVFVFLALPVTLVGVLFAFPIGAMLERVSRGWRVGLPEIAFLTVGLVIGVTWTYGAVTIIDDAFGVFGTEADAAFFRSAAGVFMGTATAAAFMAAKFWTEPLRRRPTLVYGLGGALAVLIILSALTWTVVPLPGA